MSRHIWTIDEMILLEDLWPDHSCDQIALRICRDATRVATIHRMAAKIGLHKNPRHPRKVLVRIRQLHAEGLNDAEIARRMADVDGMEIERRSVAAVRARFGLPVNREAVKEALRRAVKTQHIRLGVRSTGELRARAFRNFAIECGWPEDCLVREVQILNALAARGVPMTAAELCKAIGVSTATRHSTGSRRIPLSGNGRGGTYTANLIRRGLLIRLVRACRVIGRGKGRSVDLYSLGPRALSLLEDRARWQANETSRDSRTSGS